MMYNLGYIILSAGIFYLLNYLLGFILKLLFPKIKKHDYLLSVLIATLHSVLASLYAVYYTFCPHGINIELCISMSVGYFIYDFIYILTQLKLNTHNIISSIHHVVTGSLLFYTLCDLKIIDIAISGIMTELTMPLINLQWIIDTYWGSQNVIYKIVSFLNIIIYFLLRICLTTYTIIIYPNDAPSFCLYLGLLLIIFNYVWFYQIIKKYFKGDKEKLM